VRITASVLIAALLLAACGGDDDDDDDDVVDAGADAGAECGPGDAPADGVTVAGGGGEPAGASFGQLHSSPNNDCTAPHGGPTSLTIQGAQTDPADPARFLVLCLPSPDQIGDAPIPLDDDARVQLIDLAAAPADGCRLALDRDRAPSGEITFSGFCADGTDPAGYALAFSGSVPLLRTCGEDEAEAIDAELGGSAAVIADNL